MLRSLFAVVFLLPLAFTDDNIESEGECTMQGSKCECRCDELRTYNEVFLMYTNSTELKISDCDVVQLGPGYFLQDNPLQKITFHNIKELTLGGIFPSQLTELHIEGVGLKSISKSCFSGDTRLQQLLVRNSTIHEIQRDTFEHVAVEKAHFRNVNFQYLEDDALAFVFDMKKFPSTEHAEIYFHGCRFPDLEEATVSVAEPGKIKFVDNILSCTSLPQTYDWLYQMVGEQKQKGLMCNYLDENFCESKRDGNKLLRKLFASSLLSNSIGNRLQDECPAEYQQFLYVNPHLVSAGWLVRADFALLVFFGVMLLGK